MAGDGTTHPPRIIYHILPYDGTTRTSPWHQHGGLPLSESTDDIWMRFGFAHADERDGADWNDCYCANAQQALELNGVRLPLTLVRTELETIDTGTRDLTYHYESAPYDASQAEPLTAGQAVQVNLISGLEVRTGTDTSQVYRPQAWRPQRFQILDSSNTALLPQQEQYYFDLKGRTKPRVHATRPAPRGDFDFVYAGSTYSRALPESHPGSHRHPHPGQQQAGPGIYPGLGGRPERLAEHLFLSGLYPARPAVPVL